MKFNTLEEFYAVIIKENLLTRAAYLEKYAALLEQDGWLSFFLQEVKEDDLLLQFPADPDDPPYFNVPGGAWPGGFGRVSITEHADAPTTEENIAACQMQARLFFFQFPAVDRPGRRERFAALLAGKKDITAEDLPALEAQLTPFERSDYLQAQARVDVSLYVSREQPVSVRIDGTDDGAEMCLFATREDAMSAIHKIARYNLPDARRLVGFQLTD